jgi:hypothetical protein
VRGAHRGEPHGVETFAAVIQHDHKLAHDPVLPWAYHEGK